jgi:hypothetical protein
MGCKEDFFKRGSFFRNGTTTRFWEDSWLGGSSLASQYKSLYNIVRHKNVLVADVLQHRPLNIGFTRVLSNDKWKAWIQLVRRLMRVHLTAQPYSFKWNLIVNGNFLVKSMYVGHTVTGRFNIVVRVA